MGLPNAATQNRGPRHRTVFAMLLALALPMVNNPRPAGGSCFRCCLCNRLKYSPGEVMIWIAPSEKDTDNAALGKRLWDAADQFRANSGLKAQEYSWPEPISSARSARQRKDARED